MDPRYLKLALVCNENRRNRNKRRNLPYLLTIRALGMFIEYSVDNKA